MWFSEHAVYKCFDFLVRFADTRLDYFAYNVFIFGIIVPDLWLMSYYSVTYTCKIGQYPTKILLGRQILPNVGGVAQSLLTSLSREGEG